jgi:hypothetical protein
LYAALVATQLLGDVVASLESARRETVAGRLREALKTRADDKASDRNRKEAIRQLAEAAAGENVAPPVKEFHNPQGWACLVASAAFGGEMLRAACCWTLRPNGACLRGDACVRHLAPPLHVAVLTCTNRGQVGAAEYQIDAQLRTALYDLTSPAVPYPKCELLWAAGDYVFACDATTDPPDHAGYRVERVPRVLFVNPAVPNGNAVLRTDNGFVELDVAGTTLRYRLTGLVYLVRAHYNSYVRFGDKWYLDQYNELVEDRDFDDSRVRLQRAEDGARLQFLALTITG